MLSCFVFLLNVLVLEAFRLSLVPHNAACHLKQNHFQLTVRTSQQALHLAADDDDVVVSDVTVTPPELKSERDMEIDDDEALIRRLEEEIMSASGVGLDQLINPSKVVNLERDILVLGRQLESGTLSAEEAVEVEALIEKKKSVLVVEKRAVMRGWLKGLFVGQSVLAGGLSLLMVYDAVPGYHLALPIKVLGFWMWWLFIIPSLRARKPVTQEKTALDFAFLATPVVSLVLPSLTKDVAIIWWANALVVAACYGYGFLGPAQEEEEYDGAGGDNEAAEKLEKVGWEVPRALLKAFKALDYGSGQERGARK